MKEFKLLKGDVFEESYIPDVLFRGQKAYLSATIHSEWPGHASMLLYLNYQCGNNQNISLLSQIPTPMLDGWKTYSPEGFVLNKNNLEAKLEKTDPVQGTILNHSAAAKIDWTITDS